MNPLLLDTMQFPDSPVIVALDYDNQNDVMQLLEKLNPDLCKLKIGKELFTSCGPQLVQHLVISGYKVFLDLKFHDIPNTVYKACKAAANLGVWMINVHASGGSKMLEAARKGVNESVNPDTLLIAVTTLTSMSEDDLKETDIMVPLTQHTLNLAQLSYNCGIDGVVCSALEAAKIKEVTASDFLSVCPGIRLADSPADDQTRIMTPGEALRNQADYLVIGRPITQADNPEQKLRQILAQI